jgi:hypothetical protein
MSLAFGAMARPVILLGTEVILHSPLEYCCRELPSDSLYCISDNHLR